MINLSPSAQTTLLLTSYFGKAGNEKVRPLTNVEWGRFALWLKEKSATPEDLLVAADPKPLLSGWHDRRISLERILQLLNRGHSLALAVEKWQRAGLWVVTRSDPEYPKRLKSRLKMDSPPVLFGCGNKSLLNEGGIAVVGSRKASDVDLDFSEKVGAKAASQGVAIISGGARGVDEAAMLGAMHASGNVTGILTDSLLKTATSAKWRRGLMDDHVVLVSPFYPEASFNAGNAMARNKYIYCLADSSLVVHSGKKGGTLNGAEENLRKQWVPLWVKPTRDKEAANKKLVEKGGRWCAEDIQALDIHLLLSASPVVENNTETAQRARPTQDDVQSELFSNQALESESENVQAQERRVTENTAEGFDNSPPEPVNEPIDFYRLFVNQLSLMAASPVNENELVEKTGLHKSQVKDWLKRALNDGFVKKLNRPVRYQHVKNKE